RKLPRRPEQPSCLLCGISSHADTGAGGLHHPNDAHLRAGPAAGPPGGQAAGAGGMLAAPEAAVPRDAADVRRDVRPHVEPAHHGHHGVKVRPGRLQVRALSGRVDGDSCAGGAPRWGQTSSPSSGRFSYFCEDERTGAPSSFI
uniref:Uncharacterized protein n=1 Tax=Triticum urartu TaxID=4572 RepID=A0A8R7VDC8_TRIUA